MSVRILHLKIVVLIMCLYLPSVGQSTAQLMDSANAYINKDFKKASDFATAAHRSASRAANAHDIASPPLLLGYSNSMRGTHENASKHYVAPEPPLAIPPDAARLQTVCKEP